MKRYMLSTFDNPFNPFENFEDWNRFDVEKGYYSCSRLARIAKYSDEMTDVESEAENKRAIDEFIMYDPTNIYIRVEHEVPDQTLLTDQ